MKRCAPVRRALTSLLGAGSLACTTAATRPAPIASVPPPPAAAACATEAGICLEVEPDDAEIVVNEESKGRVSDHEGGFLALEPGIYQITLKARGHKPWRAEVAVKARAEPLQIELERNTEAP